jgi:hypothetical protein
VVLSYLLASAPSNLQHPARCAQYARKSYAAQFYWLNHVYTTRASHGYCRLPLGCSWCPPPTCHWTCWTPFGQSTGSGAASAAATALALHTAAGPTRYHQGLAVCGRILQVADQDRIRLQQQSRCYSSWRTCTLHGRLKHHLTISSNSMSSCRGGAEQGRVQVCIVLSMAAGSSVGVVL